MRTILIKFLTILRAVPGLGRIVDLILPLLREVVEVENPPYVAHYGCPNSKRTSKLQLAKRAWR